jgi:acyl-CoA synthetase (AMP-forming)/AMP-acid ligase II
MAESGEILSYRELDDRTNQLAQLLYQRGLRPGDHIAILAENHISFFEVFWAAVTSGLYVTAINRYLSPEEAAYLVNDSGSEVLITTYRYHELAFELSPLIPACPIRLMIDGNIQGWEAYEDVVAVQPVDPIAERQRGDCMLYSSGTTGQPKGIKRPLSGKALDDPSYAGVSSLERFLMGMDDSTIYLSPAPLYHSAPLQWGNGVIELGGTIVVMETFDEARYLELVEKYSITHSQLVPTMFVRLLKLPDEVRTRHDLTSLVLAVHAAAPCPVEVKAKMIEWWGPVLTEYYSGTEGIGLTYVESADWLEHPGTVGKAILGVLHICGDDGNELPTGERGLVYFENESTSFEYHGDPAKTKDARHPQHANWNALGDVGYLDVDGYLYLTDRKAFMIISGGVNIYPQEIEDCFALHEKVADIAVFGLPDAEMGEFVQAVVQPAQGIEASPALAEELRAFARGSIANYKVPRVIDFRSELPRLPTGKLYKRPLRDEYLRTEQAGDATV